jgi:Cys-tRNA synthase (O-phospho-L-seryl-tRNA:Cys-tRNA synthase)
MPVVLRYKGFRFFFYSSEGSSREPVHVHVVGSGGEAKYWVSPIGVLAESNGFDARTLRELLDIVEQNAELIERTWNEYFS